jgi:hypothetical protein
MVNTPLFYYQVVLRHSDSFIVFCISSCLIVFDLFAIVVVTTGRSSLVLRVKRAGTGHSQHYHRQAHTIPFFSLCFKEMSKFYLSMMF